MATELIFQSVLVDVKSYKTVAIHFAGWLIYCISDIHLLNFISVKMFIITSDSCHMCTG